MREESLVDDGQAFFQGGIGRQFLPQPDESPDDVNAHRERLGAIEDIGGLECSVFGIKPWAGCGVRRFPFVTSQIAMSQLR